ncbi:hypothetical protein, partial [Rhodopirellula baltica]|uniref:hypothetical protein n=1 Tax=Rhodopirellula baltica TaxID=265606 RepID=UPI001F22A707
DDKRRAVQHSKLHCLCVREGDDKGDDKRLAVQHLKTALPLLLRGAAGGASLAFRGVDRIG